MPCIKEGGPVSRILGTAMSGAQRIKVLVVDDHKMVADGLAEILQRESDFEVIPPAGTVAEATASTRQHLPDVVLMDFRLPDGDGIEATGIIKSERPQTKVVMLTASTDDSVLVSAIEAGCSGFITKDRASQDVVTAVRAAHAGEALISPDMLARVLPKLRRDRRGIGTNLTARELEVLQLLAEGISGSSIAERLFISPKTARNHIQNILMKLNAHSRLEAVATATREGIIKYP